MHFKEDWSQARDRLKAWWNGESDRPVVQVTAPHKDLINGAVWDPWSFVRYPNDLTIGIQGFEKSCQDTFFGGEAYPNLHINLGPGIGAAYLGASPRFRSDSETVWFETPKPWEELQHFDFDPKNRWWLLTRQIASMAIEAADGRFIVGTTDLGGIVDIAASLRGSQNLAIDLFKRPRKVKSLCGSILELWHQYYNELHMLIGTMMDGSSAWMGIWSPKRWYPIQCDFSAMLSPHQFEEFVLPHLKEQCKRLDHTIYHWDGPGQIHHLDHLLSISELDGIQWTPGAGHSSVDSSVWFPIYRRIQEKGKLLVLLGVESKTVQYLLRSLSPKGLLIRTTCRTEEEANNILKRAKQI